MASEAHSPNWVAIDACTLPTVQQPLRVMEFDDLFATALRGVDRLSPTRLRLELDPAAEAQARDLADRETACCGFFGFEFTTGPTGSVRMEISVPEQRVNVLDRLAARAQAG